MDRYEFIWKAIQKHGYKYDYRKVEYINNKTKVCIICPEHGEFWQRPDAHLYQNQNCPICEHRCKKYTTEEFIKKARDIHGDKYDYSKVNYKINNIRNVNIFFENYKRCKEKDNASKGCSFHLNSCTIPWQPGTSITPPDPLLIQEGGTTGKENIILPLS